MVCKIALFKTDGFETKNRLQINNSVFEALMRLFFLLTPGRGQGLSIGRALFFQYEQAEYCLFENWNLIKIPDVLEGVFKGVFKAHLGRI